MDFSCKACGECCRNIGTDPNGELDRGDGVCRYYDEQARLCSIYENRPLACRVDKTFSTRLQNDISATAFYMVQAKVCTVLHPDNADMPQRTEAALRDAGLFDEHAVCDLDVVRKKILEKLTEADFRPFPSLMEDK